MNKNKRRFGVVVVLAGIIMTAFIGYFSRNIVTYDPVDVVGTSGQFFRFHVLANSDSNYDQQLKIKVRDAVVTYLTPKLKSVKTLAEAQAVIRTEKDQLTRIAQNELVAEGAGYAAAVQIGEYDFPIKSYGELVLPAGKYQAVKIILGKGEGKNWWCVLFPPLCFVDVTQVTGAVGKNLEMETIPANEVKYTWKIMEIIKSKVENNDR